MGQWSSIYAMALDNVVEWRDSLLPWTCCLVQERDSGCHSKWPQVFLWTLCMRHGCCQGDWGTPCWEWCPVHPQKPIPAWSSAVNVLCSTLGLCCRISPLLSGMSQVKGFELGIFCVSQPFASCICWNLIAPEKLYFVALALHLQELPASCGRDCFTRTLTLQPSISCTLVLGRFCGSAGCPWILLKDMTLWPARGFPYQKCEKAMLYQMPI